MSAVLEAKQLFEAQKLGEPPTKGIEPVVHPIVLLDVDETLVMSNKHYGVHDGGYRYNQPLVTALKQAGLTEVYLFTAYQLSSISKTAEDEPIGVASRLKLINHLASQGITVKGVLNLLDPLYRQGVGAYYQTVIRPFEERVLKGESLLEGPRREAYDRACLEEVQLLEKAKQDKTLLDKGHCFAYAKAKFQVLYPKSTFLFFDDRPEYLRQIEQVNEKNKTPLLTFRVRPQDSQADYSQVLEGFLKYTHNWQSLQKEIEASKEVRQAPLVLSKLKEALDLIRPFNEIPLAFPIQLEAVRHQFHCFVESFKRSYPPEPETLLSEQALEHAIHQIAEQDKIETEMYKLWGYGKSPLLLSQRTAQKLLSEDAQGRPIRCNLEGSAQVSCVAGVFFKRGRGLQTLTEAFIFELGNCLGGGFIAPTRLLVIEKPNQEKVLLQASLGVGEIGLDKILLIPTGVQGLKELVGKEELLEILPDLISGQYFENWLKKQEPKPELSFEGQKIYFLQALQDEKRLKNKWPRDFQARYQQYSKIKGVIAEKAIERALGIEQVPWLKVLALMETYPKLLQEGSLDNLACLPELFEAIHQVYPNVNSEVILQHAPTLLSHISRKNYSQHFLLSLLTGPNDGKGDNFRVSITRENGLPTELQLISIDNDLAFRQRFHRGKPEVRTVIYTLSHLLQQPIEQSVIRCLTEVSENAVLLKVCLKIISLQEYYQHLFKRFYQEDDEGGTFKNEVTQALGLEDFFKEGFSERWLEVLGNISQKSPLIPSHEALLQAQCPTLSHYYQALGKALHFDAEKMVLALYNRHEPEVNKRYDVQTLLPNESSHFEVVPSPHRTLASFLSVQLEKMSNKDKIEALAIELLLEIGVKPVFSKLCLSVEDFTVLFARRGRTFIHWLKYLDAELYLRFSDKPGDGLSFREPRLLYNIIPLQNPWLIEGLIDYGFAVDSRGPHGYTPLHCAARFNLDKSIPALITAGANTGLECEGQTALALVMEKQSKETGTKKTAFNQTVQALIALGVPYKGSSLTLALSWVSQHQTKIPTFCEALLLNNHELAWAFTLDNITQTKKPDNPIILQGLDSERYLNPSIHQQIFKEGEFPKDNLYGRHNVTKVLVPFTPKHPLGVHFKENPEFLGRELMVHHLGRALFGPITPFVAVLKFTKKITFLWREWREVGYPVLATETIPGDLTLQDILDEPGELAKIEPKSFAQALLLTLLINPEDGRGDNYMLQPIYQQTGYQYRLVPIDNDRAFVRPLKLNPDGSSVAGPPGLNVKTVLYCLEQMKEPLAAAVVETFLQHSPFELLQQWLKGLALRQSQINKLFSKEEHEAFKAAEPKIDLQMVFKPSVIADLYEKFKQIQHALRENPYLSGMQLLCRVIPALGYRYQAAFNTLKTPSSRFDSLTEGCFEVSPLKKTVSLPSGRTQTKTLSKTKSSLNDIVRLTGVEFEKKSLIERLLVEEEPSTLEVALQRLTEVHEEASKLQKIQQEVYQGNFEAFQRLQPSHQQAIINGEGVLKPFDFSLMKKPTGEVDIGRQGRLLILLGSLSFTALRIYRSLALKEGLISNPLRTLLQGSEETLTALELNDCGELNPSAVLTIQLRCPRLEELGLVNLSFSGNLEFESNPFPMLRVLRLENLNIKACRFRMPMLERLTVINANLGRLSTQSRALRSLELRSCSAFPEEALYEVGLDFSKLQKIILKNCPLIINAQYYRVYPVFLRTSFRRIDRRFLNQIFSDLYPSLQKRFPVELGQTQAFLQTISRVLEPQLNAGLEVQDFVDNCLESKLEQEKLFAAQFLSSSKSKVLPSLPLESRTEKLFDVLLEISQHSSSEIRQKGLMILDAQTLSQLSALQQEALLQALLKAAKDEDSRVREAACKASEAFASQYFQLSEASQQSLLKILFDVAKDKHKYVGQAACKALEALSSQLSQLSEANQQILFKTLLDAAKDEYGYGWDACKALGALGSQLSQLSEASQQSLLKILFDAAKDKDRYVREAACKALKALSSQLSQLSEASQQSLLKILFDAAKDKDSWGVGRAACRALGALSSQLSHLSKADQQTLFKTLLEVAKDKYGHAGNAACEALGALSFQLSQLSEANQQTLFKTLLEATKDDHRDVRRAACEALRAFASQYLQLSEASQQTLFKTLLEAAKDENQYVRWAACEALRAFVPQYLQLSEVNQQTLFKTLLEAAKDENKDIRGAACEALRALSSQQLSHLLEASQQTLFKTLLEATKDDHWDVSRAACKALQAFAPQYPQLSEADQQILFKTLLEAAEDEDLLVRWAACEALRALASQYLQLSGASQQTLFKALLDAAKDENEHVREAACQALGALASQYLQLSEADQQTLFKTLLEAAKDENQYVRKAACEALRALSSQQLSHLSEASQQILFKTLLEAAKDKDGGVKYIACEALKAFASQYLQLSEADQQILFKTLLEAAEDGGFLVRWTACQALGALASQFSQLSEVSQQTLLSTLFKGVKSLSFDVVLDLAKILRNEKLVEYLNYTTLPQRFIETLETYLEIQQILSQTTQASSKIFLSTQNYTVEVVETMLSNLRAQLFISQEENEVQDLIYRQNPKSCFLASPLRLESDLPKQLFEITNNLLTQELPWYPARMILPFIEQTQWSVMVLDCNYQKANFDLLWDSPANNDLTKVLPLVKSSLDRLVQSFHGAFQSYTLTLHFKKFTQQSLTQTGTDTGPIVLQNIEDYLSHPDKPLTQFAETDKLYTVKQFNPSLYSSTIQALKLNHRALIVDALPDTQLSLGGLFFKYSGLPAKIESLVLGYCGIEESDKESNNPPSSKNSSESLSLPPPSSTPSSSKPTPPSVPEESLANNTAGDRYWYYIQDGMTLLQEIRQTAFHYDKDKHPIQGGDVYSAYRENNEHCFLGRIYFKFSSYLQEDIDFLLGKAPTAKAWQQQPSRLILPTLSGAHWRAVVIDIDKDKNQINVLWDDPFGPHFPETLKAQYLPAIEAEIPRLMSSNKKSAKEAEIIQYEKTFDQQGLGTNSYDCGPILFQNVRDYAKNLTTPLATFAKNDTHYTVKKVNSSAHPKVISEIRNQDNQRYLNIQSSNNSSASNNSDLKQNFEKDLLQKWKATNTETISEALQQKIGALSPVLLGRLFTILDNNRLLNSASKKETPYTQEEIEKAYELLQILSQKQDAEQSKAETPSSGGILRFSSLSSESSSVSLSSSSADKPLRTERYGK